MCTGELFLLTMFYFKVGWIWTKWHATFVHVNRFYVIDACMRHTASVCDVTSGNVLVLGFCASIKGEVGGFQPWAQVTWLLLGLAVESPWSALGGPFLSSFA